MSATDGTRRRRKIFTIGLCAAMSMVLAAGVVIDLAFQGPDTGPAIRVLSADSVLRGAAAVAADGPRVWVLKDPGNGGGSLTEVSAKDGSVIRTLSGGRYGFHYPAAIAVSGGHVWVANDPQTGDGQTPKSGDGTVTELNASDGSWVQTLSGGSYGFSVPSAITVAGSHIWVANGGDADNGGGSVTELNANDGSWVQTLSSASYGFSAPSAIAAAGGHIWVANLDGNSVTELNASDGSWLHTLSGGCYSFDSPAGIAVAGPHVWITNSNTDGTGGSVTELNAADGNWIRTFSSDSWVRTLLHGCAESILTRGSYHFMNPSPIAATGKGIWVFDVNGVTVLSAR